MAMKSLRLIDTSISQHRKFTEDNYHKHRPRKVPFSERL